MQGDWIVTEAAGGVVHPDTLLGRWRRTREDGRRPRRSRCTALATPTWSWRSPPVSGLDVVSRSIGHASAVFTADQYAHYSDEAAAEAAERIGTVLGERQGGDRLMFDAIKERRHFNLQRLRDMAAVEGLEVKVLTFQGNIRHSIWAFLGEKGRRAVIHESPSVPRAWEFFRGWKAGCQWGHEVVNPEP